MFLGIGFAFPLRVRQEDKRCFLAPPLGELSAPFTAVTERAVDP